MLRVAGRTIAPPAALGQCGGCAAIRAEAVAGMPAEQRLRLGQRRQMVRGDHALDCNRAEIGDFKIVARLQPLDCILVDTKTEPRRSIGKPEEYDFANRAERARLNLRK